MVRKPYQSGLSGQEALSIRRPLWTRGPLSPEDSLDRRPFQPGGLWTGGPLSQDGKPIWTGGPLSQGDFLDGKPSYSADLSGQEALLVIWPLWIRGPQSRGI